MEDAIRLFGYHNKHNKTKQNKTKQNKTKQNKTKGNGFYPAPVFKETLWIPLRAETPLTLFT